MSYERVEKGIRRDLRHGKPGRYQARFWEGSRQHARTFDTLDAARAWLQGTRPATPKATPGIRVRSAGQYEARCWGTKDGHKISISRTFGMLEEAQTWREQTMADRSTFSSRLNAAEFIDELLFLIDARVGWGQILKSLNISPSAMERRLDRYKRPDLVALWKNQCTDGGTFAGDGSHWDDSRRRTAAARRQMSRAA